LPTRRRVWYRFAKSALRCFSIVSSVWNSILTKRFSLQTLALRSTACLPRLHSRLLFMTEQSSKRAKRKNRNVGRNRERSHLATYETCERNNKNEEENSQEKSRWFLSFLDLILYSIDLQEIVLRKFRCCTFSERFYTIEKNSCKLD